MMLQNVKDRMLDLLLKSETGQKLLAEQENAALRERKALVAEREKIETDLEKQIPKLDAAVAETLRRVQAAEAALQAARALFHEAQFRREMTAATSRAQIDRINQQLRAMANRQPIDSFVDEMRELFERERGKIQHERQINGYNRAGQPILQTRSTRASLDNRLRRIIECQREARALAEQALSDEELRARLQTLRASIPEVSFE